jgi:prepilin-type N-terminal cleavage/methylation domain-containing protein
MFRRTLRPQPGFTILELLTVMIIVGLLAAIAVSRFWSVKERSFRVALKSDLRNVAIQQEVYYQKNNAYAPDASALTDFFASTGVTVTIKWAANNGWAGIAEHASLPNEQCGYFTGPAAAGIASPATVSGEIKCTE